VQCNITFFFIFTVLVVWCTVDLTRRCKLLSFVFYICCFVIVNMPVTYVLCSIRRRGPSSISVPNFKRIALFIQMLLRGSHNLEIRPRDPGHAHLRVVLWSIRKEGPSSISVPNFKQIALFGVILISGTERRNALWLASWWNTSSVIGRYKYPLQIWNSDLGLIPPAYRL